MDVTDNMTFKSERWLSKLLPGALNGIWYSAFNKVEYCCCCSDYSCMRAMRASSPR